MKIEVIAVILASIGGGLAVVAFLHSADAASKAQMFTFATAFVSGSLALLNGARHSSDDKKDSGQPDPKA